jgi:CubicO group peptidase (beta-lactamase class C family)
MKPADPKDLGFDPERLDRVLRAIERDVEAERYDGAALCVTRHGRIALTAHRGFADRAQGRRLSPDAVFATMSVGKQFANVIVLNRIERGDLRLMMPVCELIPEFAQRGKERMTLLHLLTHTSGITSSVPTLPPEELTSIERLVAWACTTLPESVPGAQVTYSIAVAHAVLAEMVRRAEGSKRSFARILEEDLFRPLGMTETSLGPREDLTSRLCPIVARFAEAGLFAPGDVPGLAALFGIPGAEVPAGGYLTTLGDLSRFAEMLCRGGELDGARILSPAMIEFATRSFTGDKPNSLLAYTTGLRGWEPFPASIGLGFFVRGDGVIPGPFGNLSSPRTFGGLGAGSAAFWVDPARNLTFSFLSTGLMEDSFHIERVSRLSDIVVAAIVG